MTQSHEKEVFLFYISDGTIWSNAFRGVDVPWLMCQTWCGCICCWVAWNVFVWAGSASRETGKYSHISEGEHHGSSRGNSRASWRGAVQRTSLVSSYLASKLPTTGELLPPPYVRSYSERPNMRDWGYVNTKALIWNKCEVLKCLAWLEGATCSCWSTWFGGSNSQSQRVVQDSKYRKRHSEFKQISVIGAWLMITNSNTWRCSRCSDIWRWVNILWEETNLLLPISGAFFRKT